MKYTVQSSKYILKNFLYIFPFAIIPAFFFSLAADKEALHCVMEVFKNASYRHFKRSRKILS